MMNYLLTIIFNLVLKSEETPVEGHQVIEHLMRTLLTIKNSKPIGH